MRYYDELATYERDGFRSEQRQQGLWITHCNVTHADTTSLTPIRLARPESSNVSTRSSDGSSSITITGNFDERPIASAAETRSCGDPPSIAINEGG